MKHYYINAHYGHNINTPDHFAQVEILFSCRVPSERTVRRELRLQHNIKKPIRTLEWIYEEEAA